MTALWALLLGLCLCALGSAQTVRPPAVPLVCHDPYFSIWSPADKLTDAETQHWTGGAHRLRLVASVDGSFYRLMGSEPGSIPAAEQKKLEVTPTRTSYWFEAGGVSFEVRFTTPSLPFDLDLLSRPVTYLDVIASSDKKRQVELKFDASALIAASSQDQRMNLRKEALGAMTVLSAGTVDQPVLQRAGDQTRIDWGRFFVAAPAEEVSAETRSGWLTIRFNRRSVSDVRQSFRLLLAYDDEYSIQYFRQNLRPYWRRNGANLESVLEDAAKNHDAIVRKCEEFDRELHADLRSAGGDSYAALCALAYRQMLAGCKLAADPKGSPLLFPKENTSNGCIATVDVIYPMAPQVLLFGRSLSRAMLMPVLQYGSSSRWKFPFAPHDLGTYPKANAQVYGGGEDTEDNQMPVEESANMLILMAAVTKVEGNASLAKEYWGTLTKWADFLVAKGLDPENQLCTDDFLGHLAHNVNLSAKAILGIASYAQMAQEAGKKRDAAKYRALAEGFAQKWAAQAADGDHYRLTFDKPGTWSQKYNLVWDRILGLNLFPDEIRSREMAFYRAHQNPYGLPLDSRGTGTKIDWTLWTATLTQNRDDFDALLAPVMRFVNETPQRVAVGDWYNTSTGNHNFMHTRPVVGGFFLQMLYSDAVWKKWASRDRAKAAAYAPIPKQVKAAPVIHAADTKPALWRMTTQDPGAGWTDANFPDSRWKEGLSGFGTAETPGAKIGTVWDTEDIWIRRTVELTKAQLKGLALWVHHDENVEVYINGVLAFKAGGWSTRYEAQPILPAAAQALKPGANLIAAHCHQTGGGQYLDIGFVRI